MRYKAILNSWALTVLGLDLGRPREKKNMRLYSAFEYFNYSIEDVAATKRRRIYMISARVKRSRFELITISPTVILSDRRVYCVIRYKYHSQTPIYKQ